ncbi:MAG TPA: ABC transporter permease [Desulfomonilaceae bacterium]|nr:ABC transporter permease [Desulfomonilaceae bacterium]
MKLDDLLTMCWRLVLRNRRRYKAVMAGIAVGTAGFIVIQTMGDSVEKKMGEHLELLGEATVLKAQWDNEDSYHPGQFTQRDVSRLKKIPHLMAVAPVVSLPQINAYFRTTQWSPGLFGVDNEYWLTQTPSVQRGRLIGPSDVVARKNVCVIGQDVVKYLFDKVDPVGEKIHAGNLTFEVVGVLGGIQHTDIRRSIFIPLTTAQSLFQGLYRIQEIYLRVDDWNRVEGARSHALKVLSTEHKGYEDGIKIVSYPERLQRVKSTVYLVKLFVYAALGVTIILGGLGITNVMLAAVQDRTREIGLRKALGAREGTILLQFLIEAIFISVFAGIVGVIIGFLLVQLLKGPLGVDASPAMITASIGGGLLFTMFLGVLSGIYPSIRASRMDSVTAMRFE